jgi:hypothetical protein
MGSLIGFGGRRWQPNWFWGEAIRTTVYVLNRSPTKSVDGAIGVVVWKETVTPTFHKNKILST